MYGTRESFTAQLLFTNTNVNQNICCDIFLNRSFSCITISGFPKCVTGLGGSVGCAVAGSTPRRGRQHSFVGIDHEIFSTVILSLPLIQEGQLSVSGERMCTILVNRLED